jgi:hypothetical protein
MPPVKISDRQVEVLMVIDRNPGATAREIAVILGRPRTQGCIQTIASLINKGWASYCDQTARTYKTTPEGKIRLDEAQMQAAGEAAEYVRAIRRD